MKILFLDFDGVLNDENYVRDQGYFGLILNPKNLLLLKRLIDATGAKIVLSTSWREHWNLDPSECDEIGLEINQIFAQYGLEAYDKTPEIGYRREVPIRSWLDAHPEVETFVVLDDLRLGADWLEGHFVRTSNRHGGLSEENLRDAIEVLGGIRHGN